MDLPRRATITISRAAALALAVLGAGCDLTRGAAPADAAPMDGYRPPSGDVVPAVGGPATLDVAAWNVENFPATPSTPSDLADLITSLDLDVVVIEEVASTAAWDELVARLPSYQAVLSAHRYTPTSYQKIGILARASLVTVSEVSLLFPSQASEFPRPPLAAHLHVDDGAHAPLDLDLIGLHLKAGVTPEDGARRQAAVALLEQHVRAQIAAGGEARLVMLGDWNQALDAADGPTVMAPILAAPDRYTIRSAGLAAAGAATYLPARSVIDQLVTTAALDATIGAAAAVVPPLDRELDSYQLRVSDHLPVVLSIPLTLL